MGPRTPSSVSASYFEQLDLSRYPQAVKFHCYRNVKSNRHVPRNLILKGSPEEQVARLEALRWLTQA